MPLVVLLAAAFALVIGLVALTPLTLVLRYRAGTARRAARGWVERGLAVKAKGRQRSKRRRPFVR
jgi:hypothetical protein